MMQKLPTWIGVALISGALVVGCGSSAKTQSSTKAAPTSAATTATTGATGTTASGHGVTGTSGSAAKPKTGSSHTAPTAPGKTSNGAGTTGQPEKSQAVRDCLRLGKQAAISPKAQRRIEELCNKLH